ncbi:hypothetical protein KAW50_00720 [candidate division WOR-3 bacterium]|nr:hypothetical protein [candidate division WOR-3 bacterium]
MSHRMTQIGGWGKPELSIKKASPKDIVPRILVISQFQIPGRYLVNMLKRVGVEAELLLAQRVGLNPKKIVEFTKKLQRFEIVHFISGYQRIKLLIWTRLWGKKVVNHWIGTDVLSVTKNARSKLLTRITDLLIHIQFANSPHLVRELKEARILANYLPTIPPIHSQLSVAGRQGVLVYIPWDRVDFHRGAEVLEFARVFQDVEFHVVGTRHSGFLPTYVNIHYHGWVSNMDKVWEEVSVLLRFPRHDGLSSMVLEALARGKWVVWNYFMPHCSQIKRIEDIHQELKLALAKMEPNLKGRDFVLSEFRHDKIGKKYIKVYESICRGN